MRAPAELRTDTNIRMQIFNRAAPIFTKVFKHNMHVFGCTYIQVESTYIHIKYKHARASKYTHMYSSDVLFTTISYDQDIE